MNAQNIALAQGMTISAPQNLTLESADTIIITDIEKPEVEGVAQMVTTTFWSAAKLASVRSDADVRVEASKINSYSAILCSLKFNLPVLIDGVEITLKNEKGDFLHSEQLAEIKALNANTDPQYQSELSYLMKMGLANTPSKTGVSGLRDNLAAIHSHKPGFLLHPVCEGEEPLSSDSYLNAAIKRREEDVRAFHSISKCNPNAKWINAGYDSGLRKMVIKRYKRSKKTVLAINGEPESGKTQHVLGPLFDHFCKTAGAFPILTVSKRSLVAGHSKDDRHYFNAVTKLDEIKGLLGVSNTVFHEIFKEFVAKCRVLFIDEVEELLSHCSGNAVGNGSLVSRATMLKRLEALIKQVDVLIVADAFMTDETINWLSELTGEQVMVAHKKADRDNFTVNYYSGCNQMKSEVEAQLLAGRNVAIFCDAAKEKVYDLMAGFERRVKGVKCKLIDGEFISTDEGKELIANADEALKDFQMVVITPVINSGVSVQNGHFDAVFCFAAHTILPTQVVQSMRRFREVTEIHLAFMGGFSPRYTDVQAIMFEEAAKGMSKDAFTYSMFAERMNDPHAVKIVKRIAWENQMRNDYDNTLLIMLQQLGFEIVRVGACKDKQSNGTNITAAGRRQGNKYRKNFLTSLVPIGQSAIDEIKKKSDAITRDEGLMIKGHEIFTTLGVSRITEDEIKFEKSGGCALVTNTVLARSAVDEHHGANAAFKTALVQEIFGILEVNTADWSGTYSSYRAEQVVALVYRGKIKVGENEMPARKVFGWVFPGFKPIKRAMDFVKNILIKFGLEHKNTKVKGEKDPNGKRNYLFAIVPGKHTEKVEHYYKIVTGAAEKQFFAELHTVIRPSESFMPKSACKKLDKLLKQKTRKAEKARKPKPEPQLPKKLLSDPNYQSLLNV